MTCNTIEDLLRKSLTREGVTPEDTADVARAIKPVVDQAWNDLSEARLRFDERGEGFFLGVADSLCAVLGDQDALAANGVFDE